MSKGLALIFVLTASSSWASPPRSGASNRATALKLLQKARNDMTAGNCRRAIRELHRGYKLHRHYVFPMLEGICLLRIDRPLEAKALLLEAREVGGRGIAQHHRKLIAAKLEAVTTRLKYDKVSILTVPRVGVHIEVDGTTIGTSPLSDALVLNRGTHRLRATAPGHHPRVITIQATGGSKKILTIRLTKDSSVSRTDGTDRSRGNRPTNKATGVVVPDRTEHPARRSGGPSRKAKVVAWAGGGVVGMVLGMALLVPGTIFLAKDGKDAGIAHNAPYRRIRYDVKTQGIVLTAVGGTLLAAGAAALAVALFLPRKSEEASEPTAQPQVGLSPRGVTLGLSGHF